MLDDLMNVIIAVAILALVIFLESARDYAGL